MRHAVGVRLDVPEHHRRGGGKPERVRGLHDGQPVGGQGLERRDGPAHPVHEDLTPSPGDAVEPRGLQAAQHLLQRPPAHLDDVLDLGGREGVHVQTRELLLERAQKVLVPLQGEIGVVATLHEDAGAAEGQGLLDLGVERLFRVQVSLGVARIAIEGAEGAAHDADVRIVDVAIDDVGHDRLRVQAATHQVGRHPEIEKRCRTKKTQSLGGLEPLAGRDAIQDRIDVRRRSARPAQVLVTDALPHAGIDPALVVPDRKHLTQRRASPEPRGPAPAPSRTACGNGSAASRV